MRTEDGWHADNTDGIGLIRDLTERNRLDLRARRTLLIGAGGGARGIAPALLDAGIGALFIVNRTPERADALADLLGRLDADEVEPAVGFLTGEIRQTVDHAAALARGTDVARR